MILRVIEARRGVTTNAPDCHHPPIGHSRRGGKRSALGWRDRRIETGPAWGWVAVGRSESGLNINTAPAPVLEAALGDRRRARTIIAQREAGPLTDITQVEALTGGTARANGVNFVVAPGRISRPSRFRFARPSAWD